MVPIVSFILASPERTALFLVLLLVLRLAYSAIYNIFFHPIAHFKGPLLAKISPLYKIQWELNSNRVLAIERLLRQYGSPVRIGPNELAFADEKSYMDIYGQHSNPCPKSPAYDLFSSTECGNLLSMRDRKEHARLRRFFAPAFSAQSLRASEGQIAERIDWFVERVILPATESSQPLEMFESIYRLNLDIISLLSFGKSLDTLKGENRIAVRGVKSFTTIIPLTAMLPILRYLPTDTIRQGFRGLHELEELTRACLTAYKSRIDAGEIKDEESRSLVYNLLTASDPEGGANLTMDELVANCIVFLVGGTDTTTITVCYAFWELGRRPEIRAKLRKEILAAFPDPGVMPTYEQTSKLVRYAPSHLPCRLSY
jgi:cytochrome P450